MGLVTDPAPSLSYDSAPVEVRADLVAAHREFWTRLSEPGTWLTGAERVAAAAESRKATTCRLCARRKEAVTPYAVDGEHDTDGELGRELVDVVHRVRTDQARLTKRWHDEKTAAGLTEGEYVEAVGIVAKVTAIDTFCRALGMPLHSLPTPVEGEPTRQPPRGTASGEAWVPMIVPARRGESESDLFPKTGEVPNVVRALSFVPDEVRSLGGLAQAQYVPPSRLLDVSWHRSLDRSQMEFLAARVSALNQCFY